MNLKEHGLSSWGQEVGQPFLSLTAVRGGLGGASLGPTTVGGTEMFAGILLSWESLSRALEGKLLYALRGDFFRICGFKEITSETQL